MQDPSPNATAPRVTPADIETEIIGEYFFNAADAVVGAQYIGTETRFGPGIGGIPDAAALKLLTICVLVLRNGFTVTGESACASPENFNPETGRRIAREKALEKLWPLLGFRLLDNLHRAARAAEHASPAEADSADAQIGKVEPPEKDWKIRLLEEHAELRGKVERLEAFLSKEGFGETSQTALNDLTVQRLEMIRYGAILERRIRRAQLPFEPFFSSESDFERAPAAGEAP